MIKKTSKGFILYSKDGSKKLGGPYPTKQQAQDREKQIKMFKYMSKDKKK